jgi:hypothetical protein
MVVTEEGGSVRHVEIDVALAVEIKEIGTLSALDVEGSTKVGIEPHRRGHAGRERIVRSRK